MLSEWTHASRCAGLRVRALTVAVLTPAALSPDMHALRSLKSESSSRRDGGFSRTDRDPLALLLPDRKNDCGSSSSTDSNSSRSRSRSSCSRAILLARVSFSGDLLPSASAAEPRVLRGLRLALRLRLPGDSLSTLRRPREGGPLRVFVPRLSRYREGYSPPSSAEPQSGTVSMYPSSSTTSIEQHAGTASGRSQPQSPPSVVLSRAMTSRPP